MVVRVLAVLFALQFSGAVHVVVDQLTQHEETEDCDEGACAPGCLGCHHPHTNVIAARVAQREALVPWVHVDAVRVEQMTAPSPPLRGLFRPPRAA